MRRCVFYLFVVVVLCVFSASGQVVVESESTAAIEDQAVAIRLVVLSEIDLSRVPVSVELLDVDGKVRGGVSGLGFAFQKGKQTAEFRITPGDATLAAKENIPWYRLRYRVGGMVGIISMTELLRDLFELRVIATENVLSGMAYRVRVRANNPFTGVPAGNVDVQTAVELDLTGDGDQTLKLNGRAKTDSDGFAVVDLAIPVETRLDGDGEITVTGERNGIVREASEDLNALKEDLQFLTMTDKPIYQPDQTVNIRGILLKGGEAKTVMSGAEVEFRIADEDDTVLYREKVRSSEFGVAAIGWKIPTNAKLGNYQIEIRDEKGDQIGGYRIKVSRYDLPNFVVAAKATKPYYLPDERQAEVEIKADYLFGKPVTKGKVRVVEEQKREWNWKEQKYDIDEGQVKQGETDAIGRFIAKFDLGAAHDDLTEGGWRKYRDIRFAAYYTDLTTNKTEQRRFDIRVSLEPIHVYLIGDTYSLNPTQQIRAYISTFYADGTPAECGVEVLAGRDDEDKLKPAARFATNRYGAGKLVMPRPNIGTADDDLDFRLVARDKNGRRGTFNEDISFDSDNDALQIRTDKTIYKPGETVRLSIDSTVKSGPVYVDVVSGWSVLDSRFAQLKDGRAEIAIPYSEAFKGEMKVAAFVQDADDEMVRAGSGIIFPARQGIGVEASFDKAVYKPNEEATVKFGVLNAIGQAVESALGVVVLDRAVEERARTDAEFGSPWRDLAGWLGYGNGFGGVNVKDLNELDLTKPIAADLQLVAELIFWDSYYYPNIFRSANYRDEAKSVFSGSIGRQFEPVEKALKTAYEKREYLQAVDDAGLRSILGYYGVNFDDLRDPWGQPYRALFTVVQTRDVVTIVSGGPDKRTGTADDFTAFTTGFEYFIPTGKAIDAAVKNYRARSGKFIRDEKTMLAELAVGELLDRFGRPYRFDFDVQGRTYVMSVRSGGQDGAFAASYGGDDFQVWSNQIDYFDATEEKIRLTHSGQKRLSLSEAEFRRTLKDAGIRAEELRDGWGNPLYVTVNQTSRYWDKITFETVQTHGDATRTDRRVVTPVTQQIIQFTIRSGGKDAKQGTYDDITLTQVVHVLAEQRRDDPKPVPVMVPIGFRGGTGSIAGTVSDPSGAVVAGATVTATNEPTGTIRTTTTNDSGRYLIPNLAVGTYSIRIQSSGFKDAVIQGIFVKANSTERADMVLSVGTVAETVNVTAGSESIQTTSSSVATTITSTKIADLPMASRNALNLLTLKPGAAATADKEKETPRLREYFPETLLWRPELVTGKDGRAELKFRMADNITTWKMYTIASTKNGKLGVAENEVTAFQAFFVDLDPPKFLTEGDEIYLPTQVRNYTEKKQTVNVTMQRADWFSLLAGDRQTIDVESNGSRNAVFGFKAVTPVDAGKQRVTAIAQTDSDAIERPVTVRPNGHEVVRTDSKFSSAGARFDLTFPANALRGTQKAELKIYPNLYSHVAESVEGLLRRPYGCGEQTISSTYPNLMILKFARADSPIAKKARKFLQMGYERLLGYQVSDGGFTYWGGKDTSDVALTAYALRFLNGASSQIEVDADVIKRAENWLIKQQRADGSWTKRHYYENGADDQRTKLITTYVARSLAMRKSAERAALLRAVEYLKVRNNEIDEPYALSLLGLTLLDIGNTAEAHAVAERLGKMAIVEGDAAYWKLETNTPFYGWGTAGRIETTALVLQLLMRDAAAAGGGNEPRKDLISKAMLFLLKNKDRYGVWHSTQTTINVLDAFLASLAKQAAGDQRLTVTANGIPIETLLIKPDQIEAFTLDLTGKLNSAANIIEIASSTNAPMMAQVVASHYIDWKDAVVSGMSLTQSRAVRLDYNCDKATLAIMEEVTCSVTAERVGHQGYGMMLAEIGTPPGADVSRESLERAVEADRAISRYDILPDRIVVYMWARPGGTKFNFKFKPRYAINAQTPKSTVYDYYNPEAQAVLAPLKFNVK